MENEKSGNSIIGKEEDDAHPKELGKMDNYIAGIGEEEDDQEEEDQKIGKFFELIRSFREARDRRRNELIKELATNNNNNKKKRKCIDNGESGWVPTFEWEDFMQPIPLGGLNCNNGIFNKEEDGESGLDLKLTL